MEQKKETQVEPNRGISKGSRSEHVLVCLSSSPSNAHIIRTAANMAQAFDGQLTAIFVETQQFSRMSKGDQKRLLEHIELARKLGAHIENVYGDDIALQIAEYARLCGATKVVLGRSNPKKRIFLPRQTFSDRLSQLLPQVDIYIIPDSMNAAAGGMPVAPQKEMFSALDTLKTFGIIIASTFLGILLQQLGFHESNMIMIYILGVLVTAYVTHGRMYSMANSVLSVLLFNFFFTEPRLTFQANGPEYPVTFLIMLLTAFAISSLTVQIKRQALHSAEVAYRTQILLDTNQQLQQQKDTQELIDVTASQLTKLLGRDILFFPINEDGLMQPTAYYADRSGQLQEPEMKEFRETKTEETDWAGTHETEWKAASWVYEKHKRAGSGTALYSEADYLYFSVRGAGSIYGVVGIDMKGELLSAFESSLLLSILGECALAMEKDLYAKKREEAAAQAKNEQLRSNLLRSISHDLRTPLTSISGSAGMLMSSGEKLDPEKRRAMYADIYDDSIWLINLVENLLSITRIEEGTMKLHLEMELLDELVNEVIHYVHRRTEGYSVQIVQEDELILARMDSGLIMQVLINLVDNALKHTPVGTHIEIRVKKENGMAVISVADDGPGIPDEIKTKVFELFYTSGNGIADSRRGMGLGLALCRSIVQAHGGTITLEDQMPHGSIFRFTIPSEEAVIHE